MTCYWSDGVDRTPAILFTYNYLFKTEAQWREERSPAGNRLKITPNRRFDIDQLNKYMKENGIKPSQIVLKTRPTDKPKTKYCRESSQIVRDFIETYPEAFNENTWVFRDASECFNHVCDELKKEGKVKDFIEYEPCIHELLSPNDNNLHGQAKQQWRYSDSRGPDDVKSSLFLLKSLCNFDAEDVKTQWQRNFCLNTETKKLATKHVKPLIEGTEKQSSHIRKLHEDGLKFYQKWAEEKTSRQQSIQPITPRSLSTNLDGEHWSQFKKK